MPSVDAPAALTKSTCKTFVVKMRERGLNPVSCNTHLKALNSFLLWLHGEVRLGRDARAPERRAGSLVEDMANYLALFLTGARCARTQAADRAY